MSKLAAQMLWRLAVCLGVAVLLVPLCVAPRLELAKARTALAEQHAALVAERAAAAASAAAESEDARERERLAGQANARLNDELRKSRAAAAADVAAVSARLRERAEQARAQAGGAAGGKPAGAGGGVDGAALACLSDVARTDLVELAASCQRDADHLRACQQYVSQVVPLCAPGAQAGGAAGD